LSCTVDAPTGAVAEQSAIDSASAVHFIQTILMRPI